MPISPYYKRLYEEDMPNPPPLSLGMTRTQQPQRNSLGITNVGPNLGVELPEFPEPSIEQPEPSQFQINRQRILPRGGDFDVPEEPELTPFQLNRRRIIPQGDDIDTGTPEIPDMGEPVTPEMRPAPRVPNLSELDTSLETVADPQRRRNLYTALAQFSAGMGNISGKPTETTVPEYMAGMNAQDLAKIDQANKVEDFALRRQIRETEGLKARALTEKSQRDALARKSADDPNSEESVMATQLLKTYFNKYAKGTPLPEKIPASTVYKFLPGLSSIVRGEMMGQFGLAQTGLRGEQAITEATLKGNQALELNNQNAENLRRLEELKNRYDAIKNQNTEESRQEVARIKAESDRIIAELRDATAIKVANIAAQSREKAATIAGQAGITRAGIAEKGKASRARSREKVADQYRQYKEVNAASKEYKKDPIVRNYLDITNNVKALERNINNPTGVGDLATVYNFVKALDPGSVVREGEIALMQQAQGIKDQMLNILGRFEGKKFTPEMRQTILAQMKQMQSLAGDNVRWLNDTVRAVAKEGNWSPESFLIKFGGGTAPGVSVGPSSAPQGNKIKVWTPSGGKK